MRSTFITYSNTIHITGTTKSYLMSKFQTTHTCINDCKNKPHTETQAHYQVRVSGLTKEFISDQYIKHN